MAKKKTKKPTTTPNDRLQVLAHPGTKQIVKRLSKLQGRKPWQVVALAVAEYAHTYLKTAAAQKAKQ